MNNHKIYCINASAHFTSVSLISAYDSHIYGEHHNPFVSNNEQYEMHCMLDRKSAVYPGRISAYRTKRRKRYRHIAKRCVFREKFRHRLYGKQLRTLAPTCLLVCRTKYQITFKSRISHKEYGSEKRNSLHGQGDFSDADATGKQYQLCKRAVCEEIVRSFGNSQLFSIETKRKIRRNYFIYQCEYRKSLNFERRCLRVSLLRKTLKSYFPHFHEHRAQKVYQRYQTRQRMFFTFHHIAHHTRTCRKILLRFRKPPYKLL